MATKTRFDLGGIPSGDLWGVLDDDTKNLFRELLKQAGVGMQLQNENVQISRSNFRPGQYMSERQLREVTNPESQAEKLARLQFHGGVAGGHWITNYDEYKAASDKGKSASGKDVTAKSFGSKSARTPEALAALRDPDNPHNQWVRKSAAASGDRRGVRVMDDGSIQYSFGYTTKESRRRRDALATLGMYSPNSEYARRLGDIQDAYEMLKNGALNAADKGGKTTRADYFGGRAATNKWDYLIEQERAWDRSMDRSDRNLREMFGRAREATQRSLNGSQPQLGVQVASPELIAWTDRQQSLQQATRFFEPSMTLTPRAADKGGVAMRERGWLDAVFNGGIVRAALKGGKGSK